MKSQILAGGRGLGKFKNGFQGGVHIVDKKDAKSVAEKMLGETLVTKQTGTSSFSCICLLGHLVYSFQGILHL